MSQPRDEMRPRADLIRQGKENWLRQYAIPDTRHASTSSSFRLARKHSILVRRQGRGRRGCGTPHATPPKHPSHARIAASLHRCIAAVSISSLKFFFSCRKGLRVVGRVPPLPLPLPLVVRRLRVASILARRVRGTMHYCAFLRQLELDWRLELRPATHDLSQVCPNCPV
jgi:hypothetical protein